MFRKHIVRFVRKLSRRLSFDKNISEETKGTLNLRSQKDLLIMFAKARMILCTINRALFVNTMTLTRTRVLRSPTQRANWMY